ncbi:MAG: hypothetical protein RIQ82_1466 [Bacteroidota bacterium]|jgi:hypothetical protein
MSSPFFFKNIFLIQIFIYICSPLEIADFFMRLARQKKWLFADVAQLARARDL